MSVLLAVLWAKNSTNFPWYTRKGRSPNHHSLSLSPSGHARKQKPQAPYHSGKEFAAMRVNQKIPHGFIASEKTDKNRPFSTNCGFGENDMFAAQHFPGAFAITLIFRNATDFRKAQTKPPSKTGRGLYNARILARSGKIQFSQRSWLSDISFAHPLWPGLCWPCR